jgi:hypothetical protein
MDFFTFLTAYKNPQFFDQYATVCFRAPGQTQPLLFFSALTSQIKKMGGHGVETIWCGETEMADVCAHLATSFLGLVNVYWLKNLTTLKPKKSKELLDYLAAYQGPHRVMFALDETISCSPQDFGCMVMLPVSVGYKEFTALCEFMYGAEEKMHSDIVKKLFQKVRGMEIDQACLLLSYLRLTGRGAEEFLQTWVDKIIRPETSLTVLASAFFARDERLFFTLWQRIEPDYSAQFWITFWSEQVWRAYNFAEQSHNHNYVEAKRISFRLPYNFTTQLWKQAQLDELRAAHNFLYVLDGALKNGGAETSLELFYTNFFTGHFQIAHGTYQVE